jgi:Lipocalin-like domain
MRPNLVVGIGLFAAIVITSAYSDAPRSAEQADVKQQNNSDSRQIVGTWRLDSIYEENAGGEDIAQFGTAPEGLFMADHQGNFSFQIVSSDGRRYAATGSPPAGITGSAGLVEAMTFFGTYAVNKRDQKLTLHVAYCLFRSCDQTDRTAELKIHGKTMEFVSAAETSPTGASYSRLVWKRECCR